MAIKLLVDVDTNTTSALFDVDGSAKLLTVWADDFDSGTVSIEVSPNDGGVHIPLKESIGGSDIAVGANEVIKLDHLARGVKVRAVLSGAGSPVNVNVWLV